MNPDQLEAFTGANPGTGFTPGQLSALIAGILAAVVLLWLAWLGLSVYRNWGSGRVGSYEAGGQFLRGLLVMLVLMTVVTLWG